MLFEESEQLLRSLSRAAIDEQQAIGAVQCDDVRSCTGDGHEASAEVVHAHPGRVLAGASARADLVVLGRHERRGHDAGHGRGVGSVTHAVLSHAHGPVVSVPG